MMKTVLVLSVIACLILDSVCEQNFFSDTWNAITDAWKNMIIAIQRPVRPRRLGSIGKRKTTKEGAPIFETIAEETTDPMDLTTDSLADTMDAIYNEDHFKYAGMMYSAPKKLVSIETPPEIKKILFSEDETPGSRMIKVPYITRPAWRTMDEWKWMQRPHFVKIIRDEPADEDFEAIIPATERKLSEEEHFGVLLFV